MIDQITQLILEQDMMDHMLEGYNMKCHECGKVIKVIKDGSGPYECCHKRMFIMKTDLDPEMKPEGDEIEEANILKRLSPSYRQRRQRVMTARKVHPQARKAIKTMIDKRSVDVGPKLQPHLDKAFGVKNEQKTAHFTPDNQAITQKEKEKEWEKEEEKYETRQVDNTKIESELLGDIQYYFGDQISKKKAVK